jgi:hypothetical protein
MRGKRGGAAIGRLLATVLSASTPAPAHGMDRSDARVLELERDLQWTRSRVERVPHASSFDLERLQRRLHDLRMDEPRDPRVQELEVELHRLRAQADRTADRHRAALLPRTSPLSVPGPHRHRYLGGAHAPAAATPGRPYFGQRLVALQIVSAIERSLALGDTAAAARSLEQAQVDLATLRKVFDEALAADPNLIALDERIRALEAQLAPR